MCNCGIITQLPVSSRGASIDLRAEPETSEGKINRPRVTREGQRLENGRFSPVWLNSKANKVEPDSDTDYSVH